MSQTDHELRAYYDQVAPGSRMVDESRVDPASPLPAFDQQFGTDFFSYLQSHPEQWQLFNLKMEYGMREMFPAEAVALLELPTAAHVMDVGGGLGYILEQIQLQRADVTTTLCELPFVCKQARQLHSAITNYREINIFRDAIPPADIYILARVIHDWPDGQNTALLKKLHDASPPHTELRIVDIFLDDDRRGPVRALQQAKSMELLHGSKQHTKSEVQALLHKAGWRISTRKSASTDIDILGAAKL